MQEQMQMQMQMQRQPRMQDNGNGRATADPSTSPLAKCASGFAQDDNFALLRMTTLLSEEFV